MRLLPIFLILAAGCVGDVGSEGDDTMNTDTRAAKVVFTQDVHPIAARCGGGSCHDIGAVSGAQSKFYNTDPEMSYPATTAATTLVGTFSSIAPILTHIQ